MKLSYQHILDRISTNPSIEEISNTLFQLGHENEIDGDILDIEITPNRGDCLSLDGILRDLNVFYEIDSTKELYKGKLQNFSFEFKNNAKKDCPKISFMKIEIEEPCYVYKGSLENYFQIFNQNKNNFFTDISNFISYETGQPTHCYDAKKINNQLSLEYANKKIEFETLLDQTIELNENDLVFKSGNSITNLAGIMGGKNSACSSITKSAIIECAYFNPESIIGKSVKYDIKSDAAHKYERGVDFDCHEQVLRRFAKIVEQHASIKKIEYFSETYNAKSIKQVAFNHERINKILGTKIKKADCEGYLLKLGFLVEKDIIKVPSHRNDVSSVNDIAEEIARVIGYDNIEKCELDISFNSNIASENVLESTVRRSLTDSGFQEVINMPFVSSSNGEDGVEVDNPLDSNRKFLRTRLRESLVSNLLFNERRQKDSIKLYEVSNIYNINNGLNVKKLVGIIASGRVGKNFRDFSKQIDAKWMNSILKNNFPEVDFNIINISRDTLDTKLKNKIWYVEFDIDILRDNLAPKEVELPKVFKKFEEISEYPYSFRDLSFSVKTPEAYAELQQKVLEYEHELLKEIFIFDFFQNEKLNEIKMGFRFKFQSNKKTITEKEVNEIIDDIICKTLKINTVKIPGL
jgi:phenylalanyl-tRNA synthetase beta chain